MSCHTFRKLRPGHTPRAAIGHMPFVGHRNCNQWGTGSALHRAMEYGFDPESVKAAKS